MPNMKELLEQAAAQPQQEHQAEEHSDEGSRG